MCRNDSHSTGEQKASQGAEPAAWSHRTDQQAGQVGVQAGGAWPWVAVVSLGRECCLADRFWCLWPAKRSPGTFWSGKGPQPHPGRVGSAGQPLAVLSTGARARGQGWSRASLGHPVLILGRHVGPKLRPTSPLQKALVVHVLMVPCTFQNCQLVKKSAALQFYLVKAFPSLRFPAPVRSNWFTWKSCAPSLTHPLVLGLCGCAAGCSAPLRTPSFAGHSAGVSRTISRAGRVTPWPRSRPWGTLRAHIRCAPGGRAS